MKVEYNIMTEANPEEITSLIENLGYKPALDTTDEPVFMDNGGVELRLVSSKNQEVFEDQLDFYLDRQNNENFIKNPKSYLCSDLDDSSMINEEFAIETGLLERKLSPQEMAEKANQDFKKISQELINKGYKTDFYETKHGFDI